MPSKHVLKGILAGSGGVGKSSIALRYMENRFEEDMKMTIGVGHMTKTLNVGGDDVTIVLWDLAGQPHFSSVVETYFKGALFAIIVYDITKFTTLSKTKDWADRILNASPKCKLMFVGNKIDERESSGNVTKEDGIEFAREFNAKCMEVSAKNGEGVSEMFETIVRDVLNR